MQSPARTRKPCSPRKNRLGAWTSWSRSNGRSGRATEDSRRPHREFFGAQEEMVEHGARLAKLSIRPPSGPLVPIPEFSSRALLNYREENSGIGTRGPL